MINTQPVQFIKNMFWEFSLFSKYKDFKIRIQENNIFLVNFLSELQGSGFHDICEIKLNDQRYQFLKDTLYEFASNNMRHIHVDYQNTALGFV